MGYEGAEHDARKQLAAAGEAALVNVSERWVAKRVGSGTRGGISRVFGAHTVYMTMGLDRARGGERGSTMRLSAYANHGNRAYIVPAPGFC